MAKPKVMSDGEVNESAFNRIIGDLGNIEAEEMFNETNPAPVGVAIEIKPLMAGEQTKQAPKVETKEEDEEEAELGE